MVKQLRIVPVVLGVLSAAILVLAMALVTLTVRVPPVGDSSSYRCSPIESAFAGAPTGPDCAPHIRGRLAEAGLAGIAGGVLGLVALVVALGLKASPDESADRGVPR